jgi:hypothetical protein
MHRSHLSQPRVFRSPRETSPRSCLARGPVFVAGVVSPAVVRIAVARVVVASMMLVPVFTATGRGQEIALAGASTAGPLPWQPLFDGTALGHWRPTSFGGEGEVEIVDGAIRIGMGADLSGITWDGEFPEQSYEFALEARRVDGNDFFCGITFPVGDAFCSLILGGWGGAVTGLSSIDGLDAAHNDTTLVRDYEAGRWYAVTLRVTPQAIECFVDGEPVIDQPLEGRRLSIRDEVIPSRPLGIATYATTGDVRNIRWRTVVAGAVTPGAGEVDSRANKNTTE